MIRDNLLLRKPRCHYNYRGRVKLTFNTIEDALKYVDKYELKNYTIYICKECSKYHIGRKKEND